MDSSFISTGQGVVGVLRLLIDVEEVKPEIVDQDLNEFLLILMLICNIRITNKLVYINSLPHNPEF